jgi:predicted ATPase/class 3 adenylate cyclase/DNA-binding NarL/FixJ family response regulator
MTTQPTGTVTFLFTDIESSSPLWAQHPDAMKDAVARHDAILRQAIESHDGYVFKTMGDAFCAAFAVAADALNAALTIQRELRAFNDEFAIRHSLLAIRIRMGLHTGAAEARDGDYFGATLNRVARIMAVAHGGQLLLSLATAELVREQLPAGVTLRDLDKHRLKGLLNPEHLWQVVAADVSAEFPPLPSLNVVPNNLPTQLTSFVGREQEIEEIKQLLKAEGGKQKADETLPTALRLRPSEARLVTLTGSGGVGKTRLSLQVAADVLEAFPDGVWFIELAPLSDPALIPQTIASVLGLRAEPNQPLLEVLTAYFRAKTALLILDNCEHLVMACASLADALLRAAPALKILASSREALGMAGELAWRVPSLEIPNPAQARQIPIKNLTQYAAVKLFIERAVFALPTFTVTNANAPTVAEICQRLDGIPLALELAAARVKMLNPQQIMARLSDSLSLLTRGNAAALPRHQTLRAAIDWSYDLLSDKQRALFRRLAVFAGGFTLEAAEQVCSNQKPVTSSQKSVASNQTHLTTDYWRLATEEVLDVLSDLVDQSLVVVEERKGDGIDEARRYRLLETIRQYAWEKLDEMPQDERHTIHLHHLQFYLKFAEAAEPQLHSAEQARWFQHIALELDNLRAAMNWGVAHGEVQAVLRALGALDIFWRNFALQEGYERLTATLAHAGAAERNQARVKALLPIAIMEASGGNFNAARAHFEEILSIARELGAKDFIGTALSNLGFVALFFQHDYALARDLLEQGLSIHREINDSYNASISLLDLGYMAHSQGDETQAQQLYEEGLALLEQLGDKAFMALLLRQVGYSTLRQGNYAKALVQFEESLAFNLAINEKRGVAASIFALAACAITMGEPLRAAKLFGAARSIFDDSAVKVLSMYDQQEHDHYLAILRAQLPTPDFNAAWAAGQQMTMEHAIAFAQQITVETQIPTTKSQTPTNEPTNQRTSNPTITENPIGLTDRELEVLRWLVQGLTDMQIAEQLVVSRRTVHAHLRSIYGKLDVTTRNGAVRVAMENKLV